MSESVVADFVAHAAHGGAAGPDRVQSRVLLSEDRLVAASDDHRTAVDLDDVADVLVSRIPDDLRGFFDQSVLVVYEEGGGRRTLLVSGDHERIDRFSRYLYKAILGGIRARVKHPARTGGRVVEGPFQRTTVAPRSEAVSFRAEDAEWRIPLGAVTDVERLDRTVDGESRSVLSVRHVDDHGRTTTTQIAPEPTHGLPVLGRYLRLDHFGREVALSDVSIDDGAVAALVARYAGVDTRALPELLDTDPEDLDGVLADLQERGLLAEGDDPEITDDGRVGVGLWYESLDD